jgi:hypothetical protein
MTKWIVTEGRNHYCTQTSIFLHKLFEAQVGLRILANSKFRIRGMSLHLKYNNVH